MKQVAFTNFAKNVILKKDMNNNQSELHYKKMTETPVAKLVVKLGIPTTVAMLITSIYNMVDTYFVGTLGESAQGAIGILFTLQSIIQAVAFMLGHGSGSYVAKELANKNTKKASEYVSTAFFFGGAIGIVFMAVGLCVLSPFMRLLGSTETILPYAKDYGLWVLISAPFMICSLVLNNNLRYEGRAFYAMIGLGIGGILNMLGDYLFVSVFDMGVFGAGMSTAISQFVSFVILLGLYFKFAQSRISVKCISRQFTVYSDVFRNGLPSLLRQALNSVSGGILNRLAGKFGGQLDLADQTIAAMSIVNKVSNFVMCVGMGISQGLQPVASFNYQAKEYTRVKNAIKVTILINFGCIAVLAIPTMIFPYQIVSVFQKKQNVIEIAAPALRYAMAGMMFMPLFIPTNMLFQSIRKSEIASFLALLRSGLMFIPMLYLLTYTLQILGLQLAQPVSDVLTAIINVPFLIYFLKKTPNTQKTNDDTIPVYKPDFTKSNLNVTATFAEFLGAPNANATLDVLKQELDKGFEKVVYICFDGMGIYPLQQNLPQEDFLRSHNVETLLSTFPSTTTNATTSLTTNKLPLEHGWFGWSVHFDSIDRYVNIFLDTDSWTGEKLDLAGDQTLGRFPKFFDLANSDYNVCTVFPPYVEVKSPENNYVFRNLDEFFDGLRKACSREGKQFVYAYCNEPDHSMHANGVTCAETKILMETISKKMQKVANDSKNTLFVITADHGQIDVDGYIYMYEDEHLYEMLNIYPYLEPRAIAFSVKEGKKEEFRKYFVEKYGKDFELVESAKLVEEGYFGNLGDKAHLLGDFIACCYTHKQAVFTPSQPLFKGHHTGLTEEMLVPLIIIESK